MTSRSQVQREVRWIRTRAQVLDMEREAIAAAKDALPEEHARLRSMLLNRPLRREEGYRPDGVRRQHLT